MLRSTLSLVSHFASILGVLVRLALFGVHSTLVDIRTDGENEGKIWCFSLVMSWRFIG